MASAGRRQLHPAHGTVPAAPLGGGGLVRRVRGGEDLLLGLGRELLDHGRGVGDGQRLEVTQELFLEARCHAAEHERDGVRSFLVHPGLTSTERIQQDMAAFGFEGGAPVEVVSKVVAWLATSSEADVLTGRNLEAQFLCHERGLLPGWSGPTPNDHALAYDRSGANLEALEAALRG